MVDDKPLVVKQPWGLPDYAPKDFDHKFMGRITTRRALALSRNVPSVRTAQLVGMDAIVETARLAGVTTKLDANLSLALGSSAVTPLDMASAYSTIARCGIAIKPQVLRKIENNKGQVIEVFDSKVDKVFNIEPAAEVLDVMQDVVKYGTGAAAKLADRPVAGKTGTADAAKDIWFIGFTPDLVTAVWGGNDENLPIPGTHVTGGDVMAKIWKDFNIAYYKAYPTPPGSFIAPNIQKIAPTVTAGDEKVAKKDDAQPTAEKVTTVEPTPVSLATPKNEAPPPTGSTGETPAAETKVDGLAAQTPKAAQAPSLMPSLAPERPSLAPALMPAPAPHRLLPAPSSTTLPPVTQPAPGNRLYPTPANQPSNLMPGPSASPANRPELRPAIQDGMQAVPSKS
jgi:membrane peptidoglycan carboxypeptidase